MMKPLLWLFSHPLGSEYSFVDFLCHVCELQHVVDDASQSAPLHLLLRFKEAVQPSIIHVKLSSYLQLGSSATFVQGSTSFSADTLIKSMKLMCYWFIYFIYFIHSKFVDF